MNTTKKSINILNFIFRYFEHVQADFVKRSSNVYLILLKGLQSRSILVFYSICIILLFPFSSFICLLMYFYNLHVSQLRKGSKVFSMMWFMPLIQNTSKVSELFSVPFMQQKRIKELTVFYSEFMDLLYGDLYAVQMH